MGRGRRGARSRASVRPIVTDDGPWLRRAGSGRTPDGGAVAWCVAEGSRGRRWRWSVTGADGRLVHSALLELDLGGGVARLELATQDAMLKFHPAGDGAAAHGTVVRATGVDPIEVAWGDVHGLAFDGDAFGTALGWGVGAGEGWTVDAEARLRPGGPAARLGVDDRRVPILLHRAEWPLEID